MSHTSPPNIFGNIPRFGWDFSLQYLSLSRRAYLWNIYTYVWTTSCWSNCIQLVGWHVKIINYKQLLDEVFVISRIIKVEVRVISRSRRLRLITLTETLIILDITKTESNVYCFILHWTKNLEVMFLPLHWRQVTRVARSWHHYPWKSCTAVIHDMITRDLDMITRDLDMIIV